MRARIPSQESLGGFEPMETMTHAAQDVTPYTNTRGKYVMNLQQARSIRRASRRDMVGGASRSESSSITGRCSKRSWSPARCRHAWGLPTPGQNKRAGCGKGTGEDRRTGVATRGVQRRRNKSGAVGRRSQQGSACFLLCQTPGPGGLCEQLMAVASSWETDHSQDLDLTLFKR